MAGMLSALEEGNVSGVGCFIIIQSWLPSWMSLPCRISFSTAQAQKSPAGPSHILSLHHAVTHTQSLSRRHPHPVAHPGTCTASLEPGNQQEFPRQLACIKSGHPEVSRVRHRVSRVRHVWSARQRCKQAVYFHGERSPTQCILAISRYQSLGIPIKHHRPEQYVLNVDPHSCFASVWTRAISELCLAVTKLEWPFR